MAVQAQGRCAVEMETQCCGSVYPTYADPDQFGY